MTDAALQHETAERVAPVVRLATVDDLEALMGMAREFHFSMGLKRIVRFEACLGIDGWLGWFARAITADGSVGDQTCVVAEADSGVAGFLLCGQAPVPYCLRLTSVYELVVWSSPRFRRRGVASSLLDWMERWGREIGACQAVAGVGREMPGHGDMTPRAMTSLLVGRGYRPHEGSFMKVL